MLLLLVNAAGLDASTQLPGFPTDSFLAFALAVPFIQGALFSTMNAGTDLARDIQTGFLNRLSLTSMRGVGAARRPARRRRRPRPRPGGRSTSLVGPDRRRRLRVGRARDPRAARLRGRSISIGFGALGVFLALRTGSGEAIQGLFPLLFVFLFLSSMNTPRDLIDVDWFRFVATINPVSYLIECVRSLIITGWDAEALALGFGIAVADRDRRRSTLGAFALQGEAGADMRIWPVASRGGVADAEERLHEPVRSCFPSLIFPLFFFTAFAGGLSQVAKVPGFDFEPGYTAFQFCFVLRPVGGVRRRLHRLRDRARLRVRLRPAPAARGAEPDRDRARLRARGRSCAGR